MQDKGQQMADAQLADQAWADMERRLDEAMPVRRRRFLWLWLLLFPLIIAGVYWGLSEPNGAVERTKASISKESANPVATQENTSIEEEYRTVQDNPIALAQPSEKDSRSPHSGNHSNSRAIEAQTLANPISSRTETGTMQTKGRPFSADQNARTAIPDNWQSPAMSSNEGLNGMEVEYSEPTGEIVTPSEKNLTTESVSIGSRTTEGSIVAPVAMHSILVEPQGSENQSVIPAVSTSHLSQNNRIRYFIEGRVGHELAIARGLFGAGVGLQYTLDDRSSLEGALVYQRSFQTTDLAPSLLEDPFGGSVSTGPVGVGSFYTIDNANELNLAFSRIQAQASYRYHLNSRWIIGLGAGLSYYWRGEVISESTSEAVSVDDNDFSNTIDIYSTQLPYATFDRVLNTVSEPRLLKPTHWQVAGLVQVEYLMSRKWSLHLQYRHDLSAWPNKELAASRRSSIGLGVRYYLGE